MERLRVELGERSYEIYIGAGILPDIGASIEPFKFSKRLALVSNETVFKLYGNIVEKSIKSAGFDIVRIIIGDGEGFKTLETYNHIQSELLAARLDRGSAIIALGGGVVGDIAGFCAATYMRGIRFVQVPTTLLAQVDSSVGGKTGVNHPLGKNMIGAFHQPSLVWIDTDTLKTLPKREFLAGKAEVIKYGIIRDRQFFDYLMENKDKILNLDPDSIKDIVKRSCAIKADVVSKDEREGGLRAILNYGHTIGHAIETVTGYTKYLHGETVAMGMAIEASISRLLGRLSTDELKEIEDLIKLYGLETKIPFNGKDDELLSVMSIDKKAVSGRIKMALPVAIGDTEIIDSIDTGTIRRALG